jgi:hypothetical protein
LHGSECARQACDGQSSGDDRGDGGAGERAAALAADPEVMKKTGRVFSSWQLSDEYGFSDIDGSRPHWGRHFENAYGKYKRGDDVFYSYLFDGPIDLVFPDWP